MNGARIKRQFSHVELLLMRRTQNSNKGVSRGAEN